MKENESPSNNKLHIGIFGKKKSGKSTLINALLGYNTVLEAGTTTDPTYRQIEINGIGPCILIDTAGFDDSSYQELMKQQKMKLAMQQTDIAIIVCSEDEIEQEILWAKEFKSRNSPVIMVINKIDQISNTDKIRKKIYEALRQEPIKISAISKLGIEMVKEEIIRNIPEDYDAALILGDLIRGGDTVLFLMPEHIQAFKGHLSLAQSSIIRELLSRNCIIINTNLNNIQEALKTISSPPKLIIIENEDLPKLNVELPSDCNLITY